MENKICITKWVNLKTVFNPTLYPIYTSLWNNWFLQGGGVDLTPLAKPRMHFTHIKYEYFVGQRKREH